ncbi:MAG: hypothetical protein KIC54_01420 [Clostridium sp.]|nr:hypothetical protein [Clostridium sp.]
MIIRNKETKEYIPVKNKYGYSSLDFQTAFLYMSRLPEKERNTLEIYDREQNKIIEPKKYVSNDRYLLFLDSKGINLEDYAMGKVEFNTNVEYMEFIDNLSLKFENDIGKPVLSNQDEFTDYMKYKVLGAIAFNEALNNLGVGIITSSPQMSYMLDKYNISEETNLSLYKRISDKWEQGQKLRIVSNYKEEVLDKIPTKYLDKYLKVLPNEKADSHELYRDISKYKRIVENIDKIEDKKEPVKFLINYSENRELRKDDVLNFKEMESKTYLATLEVKARNNEDSKKYGEEFHTYDKVDFTIILDDRKDFKIYLDNREDIGDYQSFKSFMKNTYIDEFNNKITKMLNEAEESEEESI